VRGLNLAGMEGGYGVEVDVEVVPVEPGQWARTLGPRADTDYPVFPESLIDFYRSKNAGVLRLPFSWECVQSELWGPVPAAGARYVTYFGHYKRVVDHATSLGMAVIIEPWQANSKNGVGGAMWRGTPVGPGGLDIYAFADLWGKLAAIFKDQTLVEYGLANEPNSMSTMVWWETAQKCVDAIRAAGATSAIHVPGNGWTGAGSWTDDWYDTAIPTRSNAYGWLNANGEGAPLFDPLGKCVAEVHLYLDEEASGESDALAGPTAARDRLSIAVNEASARGYQVFVGEIGLYAGEPGASAAWTDFLDYLTENAATCIGFAWWAGGNPGWWDDVHAPHFAVTPAGGGNTVNLDLIEDAFTNERTPG